LLALVLAAAPAVADETWLLGPGASYHFKRDGYNELHLGGGAEWRGKDDAFAVFAQDNSYNQLSVYAAWSRQPWRVGKTRVGGMAGLANGYGKGRREHRVSQLQPFVGLSASLDLGSWGLNVAVLPNLIFVQTKWSLR